MDFASVGLWLLLMHIDASLSGTPPSGIVQFSVCVNFGLPT